MRTAVATALSLTGVLVAGSAAALVNTQVLQSKDGEAPVGALSSTTTGAAVTTTAAPIVVAPASTSPGATQATYQVGDAGLVTVDAAGGALTLVSAVPNPGWTVASSGAGPMGGLEVHFVSATTDVRFSAVLVDGSVVTDVGASELGGGAAPTVPGTSGHSDDDSDEDESDDSGHDDDSGEEDGRDDDD